MGSILGLRAAKGISSVQAWFPADLGENLFKTAETLKGLPYGVIAQSARGPGFKSQSGHVHFPLL